MKLEEFFFVEDKVKIVLIFLIAFVLWFFLIKPTIPYDSGDGFNHFLKAQGCPEKLTDEKWKFEACELYAPLLGWISKPFSHQYSVFLDWIFILIGIITPLVLFNHTRNWVTIFFYFCTSYFFYVLSSGIYAQALAMILAFLLFYEKKWWKELLLFLLLIISHGHAFILGIVILACKYIPQAFLACTATFKNGTPDFLLTKVKFEDKTGKQFLLGDFFSPFVKIVPFPFLLMCLKGNFDFKKHSENFLILVLVLAGFFYSQRIFYLVSLFLTVGVTRYYACQSGRVKRFVLFGGLLFFVVQIVSFFNQIDC